jgi:hypothetical protein
VSIILGRTVEEVRELVHEYELVRHGHKGAWLAGRGLKADWIRRWRNAVYEGDLDRGLIPREGSPMTVPPRRRTALEKARAAERAAQEAELAKLNARVRELEETNAALGKAIGLLHAMNEQGPGTGPTRTDPSGS